MQINPRSRQKYILFIITALLLLALTACDGQDLGDPEGKNMTITLHYISGGRDNPLEREIPIPAADEIPEMARSLVEDFRNPTQIGKTYPIIPPGTRLLDLKIMDGLAYLDFSREMQDNHYGGLEAEVNTIYSLVQTLTQFPQVKAVQFLIEGQQVKTIATGAVDLTEPVHPLAPNQITPDMYSAYKEKISLPPAGSCTWSQLVQWEGSFALPPGQYQDLAWGDLNGDGQVEVVVAIGEKVAIWTPSERGYRLTGETSLKAVEQILLGKTRGQKQAEIIACTDRKIYILGREGNGYRQLASIETPAPMASVAVGDTTGDGRDEIILLYGEGDPAQADYTAVAEIWQYSNGNYEKTFRVENLPYFRMEVAPITSQGQQGIVALGQQGLTFYAWNGKTFAEIHKNPGIDAKYTTLLSGDFTGKGRRELILEDNKRQDLYLYTWEGEHLRKVWQGSTGFPNTRPPLLIRDPQGRGRQTLLLPATGAGGWQFLTWKGQAPVLYTIDTRGTKGITTILPGPGGRLLYSRQVSTDGPRHRIYVGRWRQPELVT